MKMLLLPSSAGCLLLSLCSLFIPLAHVQFLLSVTSLIRKTGQSTSSLSPRCKRVSLSISVSSDWQLIQSVFLPSILNRTCLLPANFKIQFKFYSWHAFGPKSENETDRGKARNTRQIFHLHTGSAATGPTDQRKTWLSTTRGSSAWRQSFLLIYICTYGYAAQRRLGMPTRANIWPALLHRGTFSSSLIICHAESLCPLLWCKWPLANGARYALNKAIFMGTEDMANFLSNTCACVSKCPCHQKDHQWYSIPGVGTRLFEVRKRHHATP